MTHPKCPVCTGLIEYEPESASGPECVFCRLCGWTKYRDPQPAGSARTIETPKHGPIPTPQKPPPAAWIAAALIIRKTMPRVASINLKEQIMTTSDNTLGALNDHLHTQLSRLADAKTTGEKLREEIDRSKAMSGVAANIIENAKLALEAQRCLGGTGKNAPAMLGIESK